MKRVVFTNVKIITVINTTSVKQGVKGAKNTLKRLPIRVLLIILTT